MRQPIPRPAFASALTICAALCGCMSSPAPSGGGDMSPMGRVPVLHRPTAVSCPTDRPPGGMVTSMNGCKSDADCSDTAKGRNGRCVISRIGYVCSYDTCFTDADCGGKLCQCRVPAMTASSDTNHCLSDNNCLVDSDCGPGGFCSPTLGSCGTYLGVVSYDCHTAKDDCIDDADCTRDGGFGYCAYNRLTSTWQCSTSQCAG